VIARAKTSRCHVERSETSLICFHDDRIKNDQRFFASLRMTL
jgi:hypothetical protein